jgi:REP element-mobilizing transposase RayT
MPRGPRIDAPGAIHHVIVRGVERCDIFRDDRDRERFLDRLGELIVESKARCFAWALMSNHVHIVLQTGNGPTLSKLMQRVGTSHALYFNRRHARVGHLVQNRFKSHLVEDDTYLLALVRYVHCNPLAAGLVPSLEALAAHPWTGHGALIGRRRVRFEAVEHVLALFAPRPAEGRERLLAFMAEESDAMLALEQAEAWAEGEQEDIASPSFGLRDTPGGCAGLSSRCAPTLANLDGLVATVCDSLGVDRDELRSGRRDRRTSVARAVVARTAVLKHGIPLRVVARWLGVSATAVAKAVKKAEPG